MPNITKIKAGKSEKKAQSAPKKAAPVNTKPKKKAKSAKEKKPIWFLRPFVALGRYIRDSWRELRQVHWPTRKATWKMTGAVLLYVLLFLVIIVLLDLFFTWLFNLILG